jgi:hypothetical protein
MGRLNGGNLTFLGLNMASKKPHSRKGQGTNVGASSPWSLLEERFLHLHIYSVHPWELNQLHVL